MSATEATAHEKCASCGIKGGDDVKLKNCTACYLVKYCGVDCQRNHRLQHKRACKKRVAELRDELLFKQPESSHLGDCPICLLPIPLFTSLETMKYTVYSCCSKVVCDGCDYTNKLRQLEARLTQKCVFCRRKTPRTDAEHNLNQKKRIEANDPFALHEAGVRRFNAGDYSTAIEYWETAAGLGDIESHYHLSGVYREERGVENNMKKFTYHAEQAAIGGHVIARNDLAVWEWNIGNIDKAVKHYIIAANLGDDDSIEAVKELYAQGVVSKEDFAAALRAHQAAVDATKSPQRDAAEAA